MSNNTNHQFNRHFCKNVNNQNQLLSESFSINSILTMDDTILRSIEDSIDCKAYPCEASLKIYEKSLCAPAKNDETQWNPSNAFKTKDMREEVEIDSNDSPERECDEKNQLIISSSIFNKEETQWRDNTFLAKAFTQCNASDNKGNALKSSNQSQSMNNKESINKEDSDSDIFTPDDSLDKILEEKSFATNKDLDKSVLHHENSLKRHSISPNRVLPNKKCLLNDGMANEQSKAVGTRSSKSNCTFYGLPDSVKTLIMNVRGIGSLYQWQDECLNLKAVKDRINLIYALPTSGGKTLVAEILMLRELVLNKKNAIFILPFVAIVQEKIRSMAPFALELGFLVEEYAAARGTYPAKKRRKKNSIYVCTIEKALGLVNSLIEENRLKEIGIIVVDELHLLGESGGRGATLEGLLTKVMYINEDIHIVGMSATIGNLDEIVRFLNADLYTGNFRPVQIKEYVKCEDNIWLINLETEELLTDLKKINYRYSRDAAIMDVDRIGGLVMDVVPEDSCLIFCSSRKNCENVALLLSKVLFRSLENSKKNEKQGLLNALRTEEGLCPILHRTIKFGVAYHHSGLTSEERRLLEDAYRAGTLCVICCTSTLAAGVNLPARRVIIRSPYVGNQFLNLSRYKQMIGRAGRAGMGEIGESILICKNNELEKVKELLTSRMDDSLSTLHAEKDKGMNNLILSAILLSIAKTRSELHKLTEKTLLSIQCERLNVNVKKVTDDTISTFLKSGVMKVKETNNFGTNKSDLSIVIPSQGVDTEKISKKTIVLTSKTELELCDLGRAAMKGCIDMQCAHTLYQDLKRAQNHLVLLDYLHLLYLVTPYDIVSQIKPIGTVYYDEVTNLTESQMTTARLLGINEITARKLRDGLIPKDIEPRVINRFYVTLILYQLWNRHAVYAIAEKFQVNRGIIQNLLNAVSSFALSVVRFCQELDEFWAFRDLLSSFSKKLSYCCPMELEALMELPLVKIGRARQLYNAGYRTVQSIAKANPDDLQEQISYLSKKAILQIIGAAKLLILEKVEDLRDEAEDVLDGIDINCLEKFGIF